MVDGGASLKLRQAFLLLSLLLIGMLTLIGAVTFGALSAFNDSNAVARHRQSSMSLMNEVRGEVDLLGRLVSSYVATANPLFLIYYYDILGMREGSRPRPDDLPVAYWDEVIAGLRKYEPVNAGEAQPLVQRASALGFDAAEQQVMRRILELAEQMKQVEQVAFAATQGLYDPASGEFVSDGVPQREYAAQLLHAADYLKLRAGLARAVEELADLVDRRTQRNLDRATETLQHLIVAALVLLVAATVLLLLSYHYLTRRLLDPLLMLDATARALARQAYGRRVGDTNGFVEVQNLAATMDGMAAAIEADIAHREVVQNELGEARARAEVAAEAKSIFLANMSHEIRTPMNAILGMAYLALKSGLQPTQHNYVAKIHDAAKSLLGILNDILDYSKIEAGKVVLEAAPFDLESVLQNALFMVQQGAQDKQLELIFDYRLQQSGHFVGDSLRLGQVLINLLSNAVKFTERGHVRLAVAVRDQDVQAATLQFTVEDTGIGMNAEQQVRLFQEFSQADGSTTRKYGGTGLGLSISKRLVESMGGAIDVHSEVGLGSRFSFAIRLPLAAGGADYLPAALFRRHALVVDDYPVARESMAATLRLLGCPVVDEAADGEQAMARLVEASLQGQPYDLLLLDWLMPGMGGAAVIEAMQARKLPLPERTIVVSALDAALLREPAARLGIGDVLQKPVPPKILREVANSRAPESLSPSTSHRSAPAELEGMRVLVAEDNEMNQQVAVEILHAWGVAVDLAGDGQQALELVSARPASYYDLVLMDLEMPILNGGEAVRLLRADERYAAVPVVAMTAHAVGEEVQTALAAGMNGHIPKPFEPDRLFELLLRYHRHGHEMATAPAGRTAEEQALIDRLAGVPGLDAEALQRFFPGRTVFIRRILNRFANEQAGFVGELAELLANGDRQTALRRAHSLKGLAGSLAMRPLQAAAARLESSLAQAESNADESVEGVAAVLRPLLTGLADLPDGEPSAAGLDFDRDETRRIARRLRRCLVDGEGEAEQLWLAHRARFAECFSPIDCKRLERAIAAWEFDEALRVLDAAGKAEGVLQ
jgi:signal transduction histidine kinase/DNA-binding response OmpR family regulator/HPt (histidine-containing phosphotransfer) domain-containing protein